MPSKQQTLSLPSLETSTILNLAYGTMLQLDWNIQFAGLDKLLGATKGTWKPYGEQILIDAQPEQITIKSNFVAGSFDLTRKNQKNIDRFISAFETVRASATEDQQKEWHDAIVALQHETVIAAQKEEKSREEVERVMKLSTGSKTITYGLLAINLIVFIVMVASGVGIFEPTIQQLLTWGGNYGPYTLGGQPWRLITSVFVHIGILHLLLNMYALFYVGVYLEPMLGRTRYLAAYISTGIFSSLMSLWWHKDAIVSAGASGAIFGLYGVFLSLLTTNLIPKEVRKNLLTSIGIFVVYNLVYGVKAGVDNAAHVGGLISGLAIGYLYFFSLKSASERLGKIFAAVALVVALVVAGVYVKGNTNDGLLFEKIYEKLGSTETTALKPLQTAEGKDISQLKSELKTESLPAWEKYADLLKEADQLNLSGSAATYRKQLKEYCSLRIQQTHLLIESENFDAPALTDVNKKILALQEQIQDKR